MVYICVNTNDMLSSVFDLRSGANLKPYKENWPPLTGRVMILTASDFDAKGLPDLRADLPAVPFTSNLLKHTIRSESLLFQARGNQFRPVLPPQEPEPTFENGLEVPNGYAPNTLFIRLVPFLEFSRHAREHVLFAFFYLQRPSVLEQLNRLATGTSIKSIKIKDLARLPYPNLSNNTLVAFGKAAEAHLAAVSAREKKSEAELNWLFAQTENLGS